MDEGMAWARARRAVAASLAGSGAVSGAVLLSARLSPDSALGAPGWWAWLLTGAQIVALWAAGNRRGWGWIIGAAVQPPWIVYAVLTGQFGFIPGCVVSAAVQTASFVRHRTARTPDRARSSASPHRRLRLTAKSTGSDPWFHPCPRARRRARCLSPTYRSAT